MENVKIQRLLDRIAVTASGACVVHCLITPVLLILVPALTSTIMGDENFHKILVALVLPTSSLALFMGCRRHSDRMVSILGILGLIQLIFTAYFGHALFGEFGEKVATVIGSATLALAHIRNYRLCRHDKCNT